MSGGMSSALAAPAVLPVSSHRYEPGSELKQLLTERIAKAGGAFTVEHFQELCLELDPTERPKACYFVMVYTQLRPSSSSPTGTFGSWMANWLGANETREISTEAGNVRRGRNGGFRPHSSTRASS